MRVCSSTIRESLFDNFVLFRLYRLTERGNEKCYCYRCHSLCRFIIPTVLLLFSLPSSPADSTEKRNHQNWTHKMHKRWWWWHRYYCNIMLNVCDNETALSSCRMLLCITNARQGQRRCSTHDIHWVRHAHVCIESARRKHRFSILHSLWFRRNEFSVFPRRRRQSKQRNTTRCDPIRNCNSTPRPDQLSSAQTAVKGKRRSAAHWIIFKWQTESIYKRLHTCQWFIYRMRPV